MGGPALPPRLRVLTVSSQSARGGRWCVFAGGEVAVGAFSEPRGACAETKYASYYAAPRRPMSQ